MTDLTEQLAKLRELDAKATQGEWRISDFAIHGEPKAEENATYIAALVTLYRSGGRELMEAFQWVEERHPIIFHKSSKHDQWEVVIVRPESGELILYGKGGTFLKAIQAARAQDTKEDR